MGCPRRPPGTVHVLTPLTLKSPHGFRHTHKLSHACTHSDADSSTPAYLQAPTLTPKPLLRHPHTHVQTYIRTFTLRHTLQHPLSLTLETLTLITLTTRLLTHIYTLDTPSDTHTPSEHFGTRTRTGSNGPSWCTPTGETEARGSTCGGSQAGAPLGPALSLHCQGPLLGVCG